MSSLRVFAPSSLAQEIGASGGYRLRIRGTGFGSVLNPPLVSIGGRPCSVLPYLTSPSQIVCETPAAAPELLRTGRKPAAEVEVRVAGPGGVASAASPRARCGITS